eukprot:gene18844-20740_t
MNEEGRPPPLIPIHAKETPPTLSQTTKKATKDWTNFSIAYILSNNSGDKVKKTSNGNIPTKDFGMITGQDKCDTDFNGNGVANESQLMKNMERNFPSYTSMIGQAIMSSRDRRLTLGEIYEFIEQQFPSIQDKVKGWRNCVRHNLSLHECFMKLGPSVHGRGNDWTVHPAYLDSFLRGHFRKKLISKRNNHPVHHTLRPSMCPYIERSTHVLPGNFHSTDSRLLDFKLNRFNANKYHEPHTNTRIPVDYCHRVDAIAKHCVSQRHLDFLGSRLGHKE